MFYVYVLQSCLNLGFYVGSTNDLKNRFKKHNEGKVFSTKRYKPWMLVYYEAYTDEKLARMREQKLKHHGNAWKQLKQRIIKEVKNGAGFTLIELLVVFAIVFVGSVAGIASFRNFGDAKKLDTSMSEVESFLNNARINAVTQTLPPSSIVCTDVQGNSQMQGYSVRMTLPATYEMRVNCNGVRTTIPSKIYTLPTGIAFGAADEVSFRVSSGILTPAVAKTITLNGTGGSTRQVTIDTAGNITKL